MGRPLGDSDLRRYAGRIGAHIRALRQARFEDQASFVDALRKAGVDVRKSTVSAWELGVRLPRVVDLWAIADVLGVSLDELIQRKK